MTGRAAIGSPGSLMGRLLRLLAPVPPPAMARAPRPGPTPQQMASMSLPQMPAPRPVGVSPVSHPPLMPVPRRSEAFTPTQPKRGRRSVTGRQKELARILQALWEEQAHVVLYTERGRGKTSLANLAVETLRLGGVIVARHTCEAGSTFTSVMRALARDLPHALLAVPPGDPALPGCEGALPPGELRPPDVVALPSKLTCRRLVCLVDEFDRVEDAPSRTLLADTIKQLSDGAIPLAFLIVGVSENLEQILGQHPSIQRNLVAVPLPFLADGEVARLIRDGMAGAGFTVAQGIVEQVCRVARGSPYMAQLLGLRLTQAAKRRGTPDVGEVEFTDAVGQLVEEAPPQLVSAYAVLTASGTDGEMVRLASTFAAQPQDSWGRVMVLPAIRDGVMVGQMPVGTGRWARLLDSGFIRPVPEYAHSYSFPDRALMHHVLLLAVRQSVAPTSQASNLVQHAVADG